MNSTKIGLLKSNNHPERKFIPDLKEAENSENFLNVYGSVQCLTCLLISSSGIQT